MRCETTEQPLHDAVPGEFGFDESSPCGSHLGSANGVGEQDAQAIDDVFDPAMVGRAEVNLSGTAKALGEITGGQGKIAMVKMVPGSSSTMEREKGFEDTIAKEFPGIEKVAEQYCMSDRAKALAVISASRTANSFR